MNKLVWMIKEHWKIVIVLVLVSIGIIYYKIAFQKEEEVEEVVLEIPVVVTPSEVEEKVQELIYVDVKGAVKKPGVYALEQGSRVIDAIEKSGGLSKGADTSVINLSKKLEDGAVIIIYTQDKIEEMKQGQVVIEYIEKECICPDVENDACISEDEVVIEKEETKEEVTQEEQTKISLNTATEEQLVTLPGIGSSKAQDIIDYRKENGLFSSIEDIKSVKGIGDALFEKIKDYITV